jgi:cytochrome c-type biogenesis protein CcmH
MAHRVTGETVTGETVTAKTARRETIDPDELARLEERRDFLRRSLVDLDRELAAGDLAEADHAELTAEYRRRLDDAEAAVAEGHLALPSRASSGGRWRAVVAVVVVVGVALAAGLAVAGSSGSRRPGDSATGSIRESVDAKLTAAAQAVADGKPEVAFRRYDEVLELDPENVEALGDKGLLLIALSEQLDRPQLGTEGRVLIDEMLRLDPQNPRAHFYLALALRLGDDDAAAAQAFDRALALDPPPALKAQIESEQARLVAATTTTTPSG